MTNFEFLKFQANYALFADACVEAERVLHSSPAMCAVGCRKALELAVKWVYAADSSIETPYKDNLQSLIHEPTFRFAMDANTWSKLEFIIQLGNMAVHTEKVITRERAALALKNLFEFIQWIDYCYGTQYEERSFDEALIPAQPVAVDVEKIKARESLLIEKQSEIDALTEKIAALSEALTAAKTQNLASREFKPGEESEFETRKVYIDVDLMSAGWTLDGVTTDVAKEFEVDCMNGILGQKGYCDYVLFGKDGLPLAVVEAKRTGKDPNVGRKQAQLYADALEHRFGRRPVMFTTNGYETYYWDDLSGPQRKVSGFFTKGDLQKLIDRRKGRKTLNTIPIDDKITDRYYQKEAIRAVCDHVEQGFRKNLLVMATGTGKTRTASSLTDVLSRGGYVTNILFLADRTALVKQARDDFKNYLPDMSLCNLCGNKDARDARIVFSTYPTMLNAIESGKEPLYSPAHFDLIIVDEAHRSIFKKYRDIFEYFDAILVGLTATPKSEVDHNTYAFFEVEDGVPTYAYDYDTAVTKDHVLVPYYNYEVKTKFLEEGIVYDELSEEDKKRYEEEIGEPGDAPDFIPSAQLNRFVFSTTTCDTVLQDLMERGIRTAGGDKIGKTIIFAQTKQHAEFILQRFNALYPMYNGTFAQRVICEDAYAQTVIDAFKQPDKMPQIVVSVDMMDTGIDVPECVNLVFFKKVRSKTKFWQMIGRGTRLAPNLECIDAKDGTYVGKRRFLVFDYCSNFEYFRTHIKEIGGSEIRTLSERIFMKQTEIACGLQDAVYADDAHRAWRTELTNAMRARICELTEERVAVKNQRENIEHFKALQAFDYIGDTEKEVLIDRIAPLVTITDPDETAKRFDNFIYGMCAALMKALPVYDHMQGELIATAQALLDRHTIPQIAAKETLIKQVALESYYSAKEPLVLENIRKEIRSLITFLTGKVPGKVFTITIEDPVIASQEGVEMPAAYDFEDYRKKVNRYIEENADSTVIYKLTHNKPMTQADFDELQRVLTSELGSAEDYKREFKDTPFGLLVRQIAKLDHAAAMEAFSDFINDASLNAQQIAFVDKVIAYVEHNGYMEHLEDITKPPFDKPMSIMKLFDISRRQKLLNRIKEVKDNAIRITM